MPASATQGGHKYGRLIQSIMHEPSQANNADKQDINTLINVNVQHTIQKVFFADN